MREGCEACVLLGCIRCLMMDNLCVVVLQKLSRRHPSPGHGRMLPTASTLLPAVLPRPATGL
jgi:hypothetical protein